MMGPACFMNRAEQSELEGKNGSGNGAVAENRDALRPRASVGDRPAAGYAATSSARYYQERHRDPDRRKDNVETQRAAICDLAASRSVIRLCSVYANCRVGCDA
jgi:hypothetical protein